jgi:ferredoxin
MAEENQPVQENKKKYQIQHDRPNCIGCAACAAVAPDFWTMNEDGKSDIVGSKMLEDETEELDIDEKNFNENKEAADSCPVNVIHIINKETKEKII